MAIHRNSVWELQQAEGLEDGKYRVLEVWPDIDCIIIFQLSQHKKIRRPLAKALSAFIDLIEHQNALPAEFELPTFLLSANEDIKSKDIARRDKNYGLIEELLGDSEFLFNYSTSKRIKQLSQHAFQKGTYREVVCRLLSLYWKYGQTKNSLLPAYANSGGGGRPRVPATQPLGAPKKSRTQGVTRPENYIISSNDKEQIRKAIRRFYLKQHGMPLTQAYDEYLRQYHSSELKFANACQRAAKVPSFRQFSYWKGKLFSKEETIRKRSTERDYLLNKRSALASPLQDGVVPGSCFEIDATVADIHIVSSFGKQYALGRPTIYSLVDRATRMVVGLHVSLYFASWRAARQALVNCFTPKAEYCARYGISITESDWPCAHIPERLLCDNGEMIGLQAQSKVSPFTELSFAPAYRPDYKSFVERKFGIINQKVLHHLVGTTRGGKVVRGDRDPRKDSIHTLHEVTSMLIDAVLEHNHDIQRDLALSNTLLVKNDLAPTPVNTWRIYLANHQHALSTASFSEIISQLLPSETVSMTRSGIKYKDMYYSCEQIESENLASVARVKGRWQLNARIDDTTTDHIYVQLTKNRPFIKCTLLPRSYTFKNMPIIETEFLRDWFDKHKEAAPISIFSIDARVRQKEIIKEAQSRAKTQSVSYKEKIQNTHKNRQEEIARSPLDTSIRNDKTRETAPRHNVISLPKRNRK